MIAITKTQRPFDPDFGKKGFALHLFRLRFRKLHLSQKAFAARYGIGYATVRDLEQGRTKPTPAMRLIVAAIARDPIAMMLAAKSAKRECVCAESAYDCCVWHAE